MKKDEDFITLWLTYAQNVLDYELVFDLIRSLGIGTEHETLYLTLAINYEKIRAFTKTEQFIKEGLSKVKTAEGIAKLKDYL